MLRFRLFHSVSAGLLAGLVAGLASAPASAQTWTVDEPGGGVASAHICPVGEEGTDDYLCFRLECAALEPLHFALDVAGRDTVAQDLAVTVGVDGGDVGVLTFAPRELEGYTRYSAGFDPRLHEEMVDLLQRGLRASLAIDWPTGRQEVEMGLTGSADSLFTVMQTCPMPAPPVDNPASLVLGEVVEDCSALGGTVAMEPGFERREDLDGDGREDLVIDYAAAACSESATLNCGTGGCTVGFFLARDEGYTRMFADVIRGYEVFPGGFLALDLNGSACGLYGFEACRKVFDVAGEAPVLVEEIAGPDAETMTVAQAAESADAETANAAGAVVVAVTEGVTVEPEGAATEAEAPLETAAEPVVTDLPVAEAPDAEAPVAPAPQAVADTGPEAETSGETGPGTDAAPEDLTVAAATAQPDPPVAAAPEPVAPEPMAADTAAPAPVVAAAEVAVVAAAVAGDAEDGPTSRHDAGPAPAVPETARFRGDGTLVVPEEAAQ